MQVSFFLLYQASKETREMALGMYEQDAVHPLNPDMVGPICSQAALVSKHKHV